MRQALKYLIIAAFPIMGYLLWTFERPIPIAPARDWAASITGPDFTSETFFVDVDGARLEALILTPRSTEGPTGAVVFTGGSGDVLFQNYRPGFLDSYLRDVFLPRNIAVVYVNKRGMGQSTGNWQNGAIPDRAQDVITVAQAVRARPDIDPDRVGYAGHSQGGWVVVQAGAKDPDAAFVLNLMGPLRPPRDQFENMWVNTYTCQGLDGDDLEKALARKRWLTDVGSGIGRIFWLGYLEFDSKFFAYETAGLLKTVHAPLLAVYGGNDILADGPASEAYLRAEFPDGVPAHLEAMTFDGLDHGGARTDDICSETPPAKEDYASPNLQAAIANWLSRNGL